MRKLIGHRIATRLMAVLPSVIMSRVPRDIEKCDKTVSFPAQNDFQKTFEASNSLFGYDFDDQWEEKTQQNIPIRPYSTDKYRRKYNKRKYKEFYNEHFDSMILEIKETILENPGVVRLDKFKWRWWPGYARLYYNAFSDHFAITCSTSNKLITLGRATQTDYLDIYQYKDNFMEQSSKLFKNLIKYPRARRDNYLNKLNRNKTKYDNILPYSDLVQNENFNGENNWWKDYETKRIKLYENQGNKKALLNKFKDTPYPLREDKYRNSSEIVTALVAEEKGFIKNPNIPKRRGKLNFDFVVQSFSTEKFRGFNNEGKKYIFLEIKSPIDPKFVYLTSKNRLDGDQATGSQVEDYEQQRNHILNSIVLQRQRAKSHGEKLIFLITLLRIRPSDRSYFRYIFEVKAVQENIDLTGIAFIHTDNNFDKSNPVK